MNVSGSGNFINGYIALKEFPWRCTNFQNDPPIPCWILTPDSTQTSRGIWCCWSEPLPHSSPHCTWCFHAWHYHSYSHSGTVPKIQNFLGLGPPTFHLITSHLILSNLNISHHITSHLIISHLNIPHLITSHLIISHLNIPHLITYRIISHPISSYPIWTYPIWSHPISSYPIWTNPIWSHISSYHIPSHLIQSEHIPSDHTPSHHIPSEHIPSDHIPSHHIPSEHTYSIWTCFFECEKWIKLKLN